MFRTHFLSYKPQTTGASLTFAPTNGALALSLSFASPSAYVSGSLADTAAGLSNILSMLRLKLLSSCYGLGAKH